jgi:hypothetical protein
MAGDHVHEHLGITADQTGSVRGGFYPVTEKPGLGVTPDRSTIKRYTVDYEWVDPPRHLYEYSRQSGEVTRYACSKQELHHVYPSDAQPISEPGSRLNVVEDDGTKQFENLWRQAVKNSARESLS